VLTRAGLIVGVLAAACGLIACDGDGDGDAVPSPIDPRTFDVEICSPPFAQGTAVADANSAEEVLGWKPLVADKPFEVDWQGMVLTPLCDGTTGVRLTYSAPTSEDVLTVLQGSGLSTFEGAPVGEPTRVGSRFVQWLEGPPQSAIAVFEIGDHDGVRLYATVLSYDREMAENLIRGLR
jgi:hypothetical protein